MSTQATLTRHLTALNEGIEAIMRDYAADAVMFTSEGPIKSREGIRSFFEAFLAGSPPELLEAITLLRQDIDGEFAYLEWKAEPFIPFAVDTFVVRGEKIVAQSFTALPTSSA